jgi:hypothetical protein
MTEFSELPPLPEPSSFRTEWGGRVVAWGDCIKAMQEYARAAVLADRSRSSDGERSPPAPVANRDALVTLLLTAMEWGRDYWASFSMRGGGQREVAEQFADKLLNASPPARLAGDGVPAGMALVPVEPTHDMLTALTGEWHHSKWGNVRERWAAALNAAPALASPGLPVDVLYALRHANEWVSSAPHGDNCYVSDHYEGDPGNRCNCGKTDLDNTLHDTLMKVDPAYYTEMTGESPPPLASLPGEGGEAPALAQSNCDGVAESLIKGRNGNADWTKAGTGANSPISPGSISRKASTGSAGSNPAAVAPSLTASLTVDWLGRALDLEAQAKRVESQTVERAMLAGARALRLMGGEK